MSTKLPDYITEEYKHWYNRGWRYSSMVGCTLDHLDSLSAPDAMYDGYLDMATGREKWHLAHCRHNNFEGCEEHGRT